MFMSSQVKHCTAYMITLIVLLYHTAGLFSSGGCCSLQPTAQPVTEQVSSSVKSESEWKWARMLDISDCVNLGWWFDFNIMRLLQLRGDCSQQQHRYAFFMLRLLQTQQRKQWNWPRTLWMRHGWRGWTKSLTCICSVDELHLDIYF